GAEPVARLDLERRRAFGHERQRTLARAREQRLVAGRARRRDRRADAAAGAGDLLVRRAFEALLELAGALAGVDQVRVAVDQARRDERAGEVDLGVGAQAGRQLGFGADPGEAVAFDEQGAALDRAPAARLGERRQAG